MAGLDQLSDAFLNATEPLMTSNVRQRQGYLAFTQVVTACEMAKTWVMVGNDYLSPITVATQCSAVLQAHMQLSRNAFSESGTSATYVLPESSQGMYHAMSRLSSGFHMLY